MDGGPYEQWGPNGPQKTGNVSNFENGSRANYKTHNKNFLLLPFGYWTFQTDIIGLTHSQDQVAR